MKSQGRTVRWSVTRMRRCASGVGRPPRALRLSLRVKVNGRSESVRLRFRGSRLINVLIIGSLPGTLFIRVKDLPRGSDR